MSVSCIGTCSNCGTRRFWLSDTMSLQLDDGTLKCLPHPGESHECEREGLTLWQASDRGRLYRETFFVCRNCGRDGEVIEKETVRNYETFTVREAAKWGWGSAAVVVPFLMWMRWWQASAIIGVTLLGAPGIYWWENRKIAKALAARGLPRPDSPGSRPVTAPGAGCRPQMVIGRPLRSDRGNIRATGPCCDRPEWIEAFCVKDDDRVPCPECQRGTMTVSDHAIS